VRPILEESPSKSPQSKLKLKRSKPSSGSTCQARSEPSPLTSMMLATSLASTSIRLAFITDFVDVNGTINAVDVPGSTGTMVYGISPEFNNIVGWYTDSNGMQHGFMLSRGQFSRIDVPSAIWTEMGGGLPWNCVADKSNAVASGKRETLISPAFPRLETRRQL
jgi:hypothetical protein